MPNKIQKAYDREELTLNPITGKLDVIRIYNVDRVLTSDYIHTGARRRSYDPSTNTYFRDNPVVIVDNEGNVVST